MNVVQIFEEVIAVAADVTVDAAELAAGGTVQIPLAPQVGTTGGKPIYLVSSLTTNKPGALPTPVTATGTAEKT